MPSETTIILAVVGMLGLFATATVYQRSNRITSRYYAKRDTSKRTPYGRTTSAYSRLSNAVGTTTTKEA